MKYRYLVLIAAFCFVFAPSMSQAAITLGDLQMGQLNELEDDDFETLINAGGSLANPGSDTFINTGDILFGIVRITALYTPLGTQTDIASVTEQTFVAYFATKVTSVTGAGVGAPANNILDTNYTFGALTSAEWDTLLGVGSPYKPVNAGTAIVVYNDPNNINENAGSYALALQSIGGTKVWEVGFDPTNPANQWSASSDTNNVADSFITRTGAFNANLDLLGAFAGIGVNPQGILYFNGVALVPGTADFILQNGSLKYNQGTNPLFPVASDVDFVFSPFAIVPEPASMLVWAGIGLAGAVGGVIRRRRK